MSKKKVHFAPDSKEKNPPVIVVSCDEMHIHQVRDDFLALANSKPDQLQSSMFHFEPVSEADLEKIQATHLAQRIECPWKYLATPGQSNPSKTSEIELENKISGTHTMLTDQGSVTLNVLTNPVCKPTPIISSPECELLPNEIEVDQDIPRCPDERIMGRPDESKDLHSLETPFEDDFPFGDHRFMVELKKILHDGFIEMASRVNRTLNERVHDIQEQIQDSSYPPFDLMPTLSRMERDISNITNIVTNLSLTRFQPPSSTCSSPLPTMVTSPNLETRREPSQSFKLGSKLTIGTSKQTCDYEDTRKPKNPEPVLLAPAQLEQLRELPYARVYDYRNPTEQTWETKSPIRISVTVGNRTLTAYLDSRVPVSVVSKSLFEDRKVEQTYSKARPDRVIRNYLEIPYLRYTVIYSYSGRLEFYIDNLKFDYLIGANEHWTKEPPKIMLGADFLKHHLVHCNWSQYKATFRSNEGDETTIPFKYQ